MHKIEPVKRIIENVTGISVPTREQALACVRTVKPRRMRFRADSYIPINPRLPLLLYRRVVRFGAVTTRRQHWRLSIRQTLGAGRGVMAFMITCIIIPLFRKSAALGGAGRRCV